MLGRIALEGAVESWRECITPAVGNAGETMLCSSCLTPCVLQANQRDNAHDHSTQHSLDHLRSATCRLFWFREPTYQDATHRSAGNAGHTLCRLRDAQSGVP